MDRITKTMVKSFSTEYGYDKCQEYEQFEHFVNFSIISREYNDSFELADVHIGRDGTQGIDGLAIIVNGRLVANEEEIDNLMESNKYLDVDYFFIQAKTSSNFDGADMGSFIASVRDFFQDKPKFEISTYLAQKINIHTHIMNNYIAKMRQNPTCSLFYVTTGKWTHNNSLQARLDQGKEDIEAIGLFSRVSVNPLGADEIQRLYRQSKEVPTIGIEFPNRVTLPEIKGIEQAFIGIIPAKVFLKLITDEVGNIRKSVFEDNIRDFQGDDTRVNEGITKTLRDSAKANTFVVLNNGITIVCNDLRVTGNKFSISGYQIVNGCQTSHVLFKCQDDFDTNAVMLPVKLIHTMDDNIVAEIIRTTNSQNAVKPEELEAMTEFQKRLEDYYHTFPDPGKLYYERRSKQWVSTNVDKNHVITIPNQIKAMSAMFLDQPHRVAGYYGTVRDRIGDQLFKLDHNNISYYTSALALSRLDNLLKAKKIDPKYRLIRWYLLMLLRYHIAGGGMPHLTSKKMDSYCDPIITVLLDDQKCLFEYQKIIEIVEKHGIPEINKDSIKTQNFRDKLLEPFRKL